MRTATTSRLRHTIHQLKHVWSELDYAQRRMLEDVTCIQFTEPHEHWRAASTVEELEVLYALDDPGPND